MSGWVGRTMLFAFIGTGLILPACEDGVPESIPSAQTSSTTASVSGEPDGLAVERLRVSSLDDLVAAVAERGVGHLLILPGAQPTEVHFWGGDGHIHVRTEYIGRRGEEVVIIQAEFDEGDTLTQGKAVDVRGHRGVEADRNWYWRERGWVLAAPADPGVAERLRWLDVS